MFSFPPKLRTEMNRPIVVLQKEDLAQDCHVPSAYRWMGNITKNQTMQNTMNNAAKSSQGGAQC